MKKRITIFFLIIVTLISVLCLVSCKNDEFTITFEGNGGELIEGSASQTVKKGESVSPPKFDLVGYNLSWGDASFDSIKESLTITAVWTPKSYSITYNLDGGTNNPNNPTSYTIESEIITLLSPTKPNYVFGGFVEGNTINAKSTGDKIFTASWTLVQFAYTFFDADRTTILKTATADYGSAIIPPKSPTKDATNQYTYTFSGWDKAIPESLTANISFVASYSSTINEYTYTFFDENGDVLNTVTSDFGSKIVPPPNPTKENTAEYTYSFSGWDKAIPESLTTNISFVANYRSTLRNYTATFNSNGGSEVDSITQNYGTTVTLPPSQRKGYDFGGWFHDNDSFTEEFTSSDTIKGSLVLFAKWIALDVSQLWTRSVNDLTQILDNEDLPLDSITYQSGEQLSITNNDDSYEIFHKVVCLGNVILAAQYKEGTPAEAIFLLEKLVNFGYNYYRYYDTNILILNVMSLYDIVGEDVYLDNGIYYSRGGQVLLKYTNSDTSFLVPTSVKSIGTFAFRNNATLQNIELSENLESICDEAFASCIALKTITIPNKVSFIGRAVFSGCKNLNQATLGSALTEISPLMFKDSALEEIVIPGNIKSIGESAFDSCTMLQNIIIPISVSFIDEYAFYDCDTLIIYVVADAKPQLWHKDWNISNCPVYWKWGTKYTVTFDANGGTYISGEEVQNVNNGFDAKPPVYELIGYDLSWSVPYTNITSPTTIYAVWTKKLCTYTFYDDDGTTVLKQTKDYYGSKIVAPPNPTKEASVEYTYEFSWWNKEIPDSLNEDITFIAEYASSLNKYTYKFYNEDGTLLKEENIYYGREILPPDKPTKTSTPKFSYNFSGWDKAIPSYIAENLNFTACYSAVINQYTYGFYNDDGTMIKEEKKDYGSSIIAPSNPTKEKTAQFSYTFYDWDKPIPDTLTENIYFNATYRSTTNSYTYTFFDEDNVTLLKRVTESFGSEIIPPDSPTKPSNAQYSYAFNNWDKPIPVFLDKDINFIAVYLQTTNQYTYTFFDEDGESVLKSATVDYGSTIEPPNTPTKAETTQYKFTFSGWNKDIPSQLVANISFVAQYSASLQEYTITFNSNGGSPVDAVTELYETTITAPSAPNRTSHTFVDWYLDNHSFQNAFVFAKIPTANITLYAKWTAHTNGITFLPNGGIGTMDAQNIIVGSTTRLTPNTFTKDNHNFGGWAIVAGGEAVYRDKANFFMGTQSVTLYAVWEAWTSTGLKFVDSGANEYTVSAYTGWEPKLVIPSLYNGLPVTTIAISAFQQKVSLKTVFLPSSIKKIDSQAFYGCTYLTYISLSEGLIEIGTSTFYNCVKLAEITFPSTLKTIGTRAFMQCSSLTSIDIPNNVDNLKNNAFELTGLKCVTIGSGITYIPDGAFASSYGLKYVTVKPATPPTLEWAAFYNCNLQSIYVPAESVNTYKNSGNWSYVHSSIIYGVGTLSHTVSFDSSSGSEVGNIIGASATPIVAPVSPNMQGYTFVGWYKDSNLTTLWDFYNDTVLTNITLYAKWQVNFNYTLINEGTAYEITSCNTSDSTVTILPTYNSIGVISIASNAFLNCDHIERIVIPSSITNIGQYAILAALLIIFCESTSALDGWEENWNADRPVYWSGQWSYVNGVPTPN